MEATTNDPGTTLRAPTSEAGFSPACKDTCFADLRLRVWEKRYNGTEGKVEFGSSITNTYLDVLSCSLTCIYFA